MAPPLDAQQDWQLTYSSENSGVTKLRFYRKLNTTDPNDVVIQVNSFRVKSVIYLFYCSLLDHKVFQVGNALI